MIGSRDMLNYYREIHVRALKDIQEANLMASVAKSAGDSLAFTRYTERAMEAEDIANYAKQKKDARANR